ncbi:hypothetical protein jhhlp_000991 [Lomentospora prolificans]|uniref:1-phosphatidylinositol-3-phosphate 5-kinase n=1 Tax=Lomentospora prolificans TaxID=41688 RepID=A0A2N3NK16_9PEZI|nr:hypothetical protein jhhlp_000991 [Lomentospora prolificans]
MSGTNNSNNHLSSAHPASPISSTAEVGPRSRRNSSTSNAPSMATSHAGRDREQLAQALDIIHTSASRTNALTTFNDFTAPPRKPTPVSENRGLAGDLVQQGLSGLYSRFKEAVGGGGTSRPSQEADDAILQEPASRRSSTAPSTDLRVSVPSPSRLSPGAPASVLAAEMSPTFASGSQAHVGPPGSASGTKVASSGRASISSAAQVLASMGLDSAGVALLTPQEIPRSAVPSDDGLSRISGSRKSLSKAELTPIAPRGTEMPTVFDVTDTSSMQLERTPNLTRIHRDDGSGVEINGELPLSPVKSTATSSIQSHDLRPLSTTLGGVGRTPAVIERISKPRSPTHGGSHSLSVTPSVVDAAQVNTSAQVSHYHDSKDGDSRSQATHPAELRVPGMEGGNEQVNVRLEKMKKQVLSKEFWMADETCKECFLCGSVFNVVRRKHHCRTCGCIFDSKCTSTISGQKFGVSGNIRVCKTCLSVINRRYDTSGSDDSADDSYLPAIFRHPQNGQKSTRFVEPKPATTEDAPSSQASERGEKQYDARSGTTPMMAIPATRRIGDSNKHSSVLEIGAPELSRPASSRSLRSLASSRPQSSGHKRHHSKHNALGKFKTTTSEERAPFRKGLNDELNRKSHFPAFHEDNIIDPELAAYMSDESSADEQMSIFATMSNADLQATSFDEKANFGPLLAAGRKHRARDKSISGMSFTSRGIDDIMGMGGHFGHRAPRRRNLSNVSNSVHHMRSPRPKSGVFKGPSTSNEMLFSIENPLMETTKLTRSESLRGEKTLQMELNPSSKRHVQKLLHQLLEDAKVPNPSAWEKALIPILIQCTDDVTPDVRQGDYMDIRHYVKFKKIPGGKPGDTSYVSGLIFTKNLALKSMPRRIIRPRVVIVSFPIEYQRHQQHFMSLQPVIEQEKEFLRIVVNRIVKLNPQVLLSEKGVSGMALEMLSAANIAVAYNVKPSVIEAVARCAETDIISSLDMLALPVRVGHCDGFEVKTYVNNTYRNRKKSYIFLSGCNPNLGCTIALRGAPTETLASVKRITEFMVYVVYNLKLETCLMRDEFIHLPTEDADFSIPSTTRQTTDGSLNSSTHTKQSDHTGAGPTVVINAPESEPPSQTSVDTGDYSEITNASGDTTGAPDSQANNSPSQPSDPSHAPHDAPVPEDIPMPTYYSDMVARYETKILSASPFVKFTQPYLLMRAREQERRLVYLKRLRDQNFAEGSDDPEKSKLQPFQLIKPETVHSISPKAPSQLKEIIHAIHDAEYDKALHNYQTHKRQWENYIQGNINLFDPYSHQNIVVLYSVTCTETKIPCVEPTLITIGFYDEQHMDTGMDPDCTLGQYIEDLCFSKDSVCVSNGCDRTMLEHHRTYVHDESRITIFLEATPGTSSPQVSEDITMWNYCKVCQKDSPAMPMCESTWKYSFGKYLELLFWSKGLRLNERANCPHDHHKDHIRYFAFRGTRVRIHYDPIDLLEIVVPRSRITWKVENDLNLKNDIYTKTEERWNRFMVSVTARLKNIRIDVVLPEKADACKAEVDKLTKKATDDHARLIRRMQQIYVNSKYYEVIPFNSVIREMLEVAGEWDAAFAQFEADFLPDKDVRQLTVLQLKKMFTDNESRESLPTPESIVSSTAETVDTTPTAESDDRLSQTFTDSEPKSSQPTAYTDSSLTHSRPLDQAEDPTTPMQMPRVILPAEEIMERVEPLDLATAAPLTQHQSAMVQPTPVSPAAAALTPGVAADESANAQAESGTNDLPPPRTPLSPKAPVIGNPSPDKSLKEKVEQLKRRNQVIQGEPTLSRQTTVETVKTMIPERVSSRKVGSSISPPMIRSLTQPNVRQLPKTHQLRLLDAPAIDETPSITEKKLSDRFAGALKSRKSGPPSSIPRLVHKKESKVSTLAKHFEQLSREFENQRIRDRKKRAEKLKQRQPRTILPRTSTAAIVEVYADVDEAVQEHGQSELEQQSSQETQDHIKHKGKGKEVQEVKRGETAHPGGAPQSAKQLPELADGPVDPDKATAEAGAETELETEAETEADTDAVEPSRNGSDDEGVSDAERSQDDDILRDVKEIADSLEPSTEELPKHQKTSLLKMLTNFWAERSSSGWQPLDYPVSMGDHIFMDSDVVVREDEPSSLIAFALSSEDYRAKLGNIRHQWHLQIHRSGDEDMAEPKSVPTSVSGMLSQDSHDEDLEKGLLRSTGTHLKYQFTEGSARMTCKIFYAEQFDALRRKCGVADRFVESMSRCLKWDSRGGKTRAVFLKTLDDRFVLKSLSSVETAAFLRFAPSYFGIMAEALFHDLPSVIAKMVGFFQIFIKNPVTNTDVRLDLLVMENLFYDRSPGKIFDLKGSMRNRKIQSTGEQNEVLLDENMVEYIYESPLFAREHSKKLLRASVWNDTLFLARQNVMDYSLMIAIEDERKELVVGIVDCIRTYTLDKKLESWIKDRGFAGGGRNRPTITSPKEYKSRFREAMARYILQAPNCWHQFGGVSTGLKPRFETDLQQE